MNRKLDEYLNMAKNLTDKTPPYSIEQLHTILNESGDDKILKFIKKFKGLIIMFATLIGIISFLVFQNNNTSIEQSGLTISTEVASKNQSGSNIPVSINNHDSIYNQNDSQVTNNETLTQNQSPADNRKHIEPKSGSKAHSMITVVDENHILKRPFYVEKHFVNSSKLNIARAVGGEKVDLLEPTSLKKDTKGDAILGITELELTSEELKNLGVLYTDNKIIFPTEELHGIHLIPFNNDPSYRYDNYEVYPYFKAGYPTTGDTFLVKKLISIDLSYKYDPERDKIYNLEFSSNLSRKLVRDTIDGIIVEYKKIYHKNTSNPDFEGLTWDDIHKLWKISFFGFNEEILKYGGWDRDSYSKTVPVAYAFNYNPVKQKYERLIWENPLYKTRDNGSGVKYSHLLPLKIYFGKDKLIEKLVLWYFPNEELISRLPIKFQSTLRNDLKVLNSIYNEGVPASQACTLIKDTSFFDICRLSSGAVTIDNIYPNPVNEKATLSLSLTENRLISVSLHDISGNFAGSFVVNQYLQPGSHDIPLNFNEINPGIYLVAIKTDKSELVVQRIVIN